MPSTHFFDSVKSHLNLNQGLNKFHFALLLILLFLFFSMSGNEKQTTTYLEADHSITQQVLKAIYEENLDKRLEYAESKPIIDSMEKYLHRFEAVVKTDPIKASGNLIIVQRRLLYLKNKDLEVSKAEKILYDVMEEIIKKQTN